VDQKHEGTHHQCLQGGGQSRPDAEENTESGGEVAGTRCVGEPGAKRQPMRNHVGRKVRVDEVR
jgi:hypothetical protein